MNYLSVGDLAQTYQLRRHSAQIKQTLATLSEEMTTGVSSDLGKAVNGDFRALTSIDNSLARLDTYSKNASLASIYASSMQSSLEAIQGKVSSAGAALLTASSDISSASFESSVQSASENFDSIISIMNTKVSGRYIFSGTATTTQAMASSETIISALGNAVSGLTSAEDIVSAIDDWFAASRGSGGFLDVAYGGSNEAASGLIISENETVSLPVTGADASLRDTLKGFAMAALVARDLIPSDDSLRQTLIQNASTQLLASESSLSEPRGSIGNIEEKISDAQTSNDNEKTSLSLARTELVGIDEYETAAALEAVQTQMETLYTLTARLTALSLTDYL